MCSSDLVPHSPSTRPQIVTLAQTCIIALMLAWLCKSGCYDRAAQQSLELLHAALTLQTMQLNDFLPWVSCQQTAT